MAGDAGAPVDRLALGHLGWRWRSRRSLDGAGRQILQIDRDRLDVVIRHLRRRVDHDLGHRAASVAFAIAAALKIFNDIVDAPRLQSAARRIVEARIRGVATGALANLDFEVSTHLAPR